MYLCTAAIFKFPRRGRNIGNTFLLCTELGNEMTLTDLSYFEHHVIVRFIIIFSGDQE